MSLVLSPRRAILMPGPWVRDELWRRARAVPSLDLRFADSKSLIDAISGLSLITYTRASSGTSVGSGRMVETAGTNVPRFEHDPATGECLGFLYEGEVRSNLLLQNRTLTAAAWVATNITTAKDQTGADGVGNSASSITATAANGTILQAITSASTARATSAYVKRITGSGAIEMTQNGGATWTAVTVTSSWSRVSIPSATVTNPSVGFRIATSGDAIAVDYVQCENGAFVTSAIETTTAAVTRNADVVSITGAAFSSWYRQDEGTVFADVIRTYSGNFPNFPNIYRFNNGTTDNEIMLFGGQNSQYLRPQIRASAAEQLDFVSFNTLFPGPNRSAHSFAINQSVFAANGALTTPDTSVSMPTVDRLNLGVREGQQFTGCYRRITYWPQRLSNSALQALTR